MLIKYTFWDKMTNTVITPDINIYAKDNLDKNKMQFGQNIEKADVDVLKSFILIKDRYSYDILFKK